MVGKGGDPVIPTIVTQLELAIEALDRAAESLSSSELCMANYNEEDVSTLNAEAMRAYQEIQNALRFVRQVLSREGS
jgi:hypothetical protein